MLGMGYILGSVSSGSTPKGEIDMKKLMTMTRQFRDDENGAAMVEYTILLGIITVAVIGTIVTVGGWVNTKWTALNANLTGH
jgi:pilus assembly protein Flp/PilA